MKHRFHFFPEPFPDETLHSVLSRYAQLYGFGAAGTVFTDMLWDGSFADNVPFPCHLAQLVDAVPHGNGWSLPLVIARYTLLPYYQPFLSNAQLQRAQAQMTHGGGEGLKLRLGLIASRLENASRTRFCPSCIIQDAASGGVAYWHRIHQLPGVLICPYHMSPLMMLDHRGLARFRKRILLPEDDMVQSFALPLEIHPNHRRALLEVAQRSLEVLQANVLPQPENRIRSLLLDGAVALELATHNGRLRLESVARHLKEYFQGLPAIGEFAVLANDPDKTPASWVSKLLRKPRRTHHPLKYILLANALKVDIAQLLTADTIDSASVKFMTSASLTISSDRSSLHLPPEKAAQYTFGTAHNTVAERIWTLALKGMQATNIALKMHISLASVYRGIRAHEQGTDRWKQKRFERDLAQRRNRFKRQFLKDQAHKCSDYMWLYRHDRTWLNQRCAELDHHKTNRALNAAFQALDHYLASKTVEQAEILSALPGRPIRITKTRIGRALDVVARFEKQIDKLPMTAAALACVCESREDFHQRRLCWAEQQLMQAGKPVTMSGLYRKACIRPPRQNLMTRVIDMPSNPF